MSALREETARFEGVTWEKTDGAICRRASGHTLCIYETAGQIEACVVYPDGTSKTFS